MVVNNNATSMMRFIKYWIPVIGYAILIFVFSSIPGQNLPDLLTGQDVVLHLIEYSIFAGLLQRAFKGYYPLQKRILRHLLVFILAIVYAVSDEWHQAFTPGRFSSASDIAFDGIGILITNLFYR